MVYIWNSVFVYVIDLFVLCGVGHVDGYMKRMCVHGLAGSVCGLIVGYQASIAGYRRVGS